MVRFIYVDARKDLFLYQRGLWKSFKAFLLFAHQEERHFVRERSPWTSVSGMWSLRKACLPTKENSGRRQWPVSGTWMLVKACLRTKKNPGRCQ